MSSVVVIGPGAIGTFFAAHLIETGAHEVTLMARRPFDELVLESGDETMRSRPRVITDPSELAPADWVLLATKAHQTEGAAAALRAACGPDTTVVVMQNGVEHEERVAPYVGDATVLPAVVYCGAELLAPGHVVHRTNGFMIVPDGVEGQALAAMYEPARAGVRLTDDFLSTKWKKLCANAVANGITALTARRMEVMRDPGMAELGRAVVLECIDVGRAEGAVIEDEYADVLIEGIALMPDESGTSMLYDRLAERPMEHDAKYGAVLRAARRHGIDVPRTETLHALLAALSVGFERGSAT